MFDRIKDRIKKDQLANDLIELGHQVKKTNEDVSAAMSPTVGVAATKALNLISSIQSHVTDLVKAHLATMPAPKPHPKEQATPDIPDANEGQQLEFDLEPGEQVDESLDDAEADFSEDGDSGIIDV